MGHDEIQYIAGWLYAALRIRPEIKDDSDRLAEEIRLASDRFNQIDIIRKRV